MKKIKQKIIEQNLTSSDLDIIKSQIRDILFKKLKGYKNLSEDDIDNLNIIQELLKFYENNKKEVNIGRTQNVDYNKTKLIIDNLETNHIIAHVSWGMGWICLFEIIDSNRFRDFLYNKIEEIMEKIPDYNLIKLIKKFKPSKKIKSRSLILISLIGFIASILTILNFMGFFSEPNIDNFDLQFDASFSDIILDNADQNPNYQGFTSLTLEIWSPNLIKGTISLQNITYSEEISPHLSTSVDLPKDEYYIEFTNYSFSIDEKHSLKNIHIPLNIKKLWIGPYYLAWRTRFNIGTIRLKVEIEDIVTHKKSSKEYIVPIEWNNKK